MPKFRIDASILAVALAGALALRLSSGTFEWLSSVAGLSLLFVLFAFDVEGYRSIFQSLALASVAGFCVSIAAQLPYELLASNQDPHQVQLRLTFTWAFATVVLWAIDRARMSGRVEAPQDFPARPAIGRTFTPAPLATTPPQQVAPQPVYQAASAPASMYQPAPAPLVQPLPAPVPQPIAAALQEPEPVRSSAPVYPPPAASELAALAIPPGKEATVYVSLVGEGIPCLRSVRAEHLGRDFYRIAEPMPEGETWEYQPGQVVRAKKKNLSSGKALVAFEEAPRA